MTREELVQEHKNIIAALARSSQATETLCDLLKFAWDEGYEFRIQEEELNKGASF